MTSRSPSKATTWRWASPTARKSSLAATSAWWSTSWAIRKANSGLAAPEALEQRLGYPFPNRARPEQALSHRSSGTTHNERLEFLGDGVLGCAVAEALYRRFPLV